MLTSSGGRQDPFKWGLKKAVGRTNKNIQFFESFTYEGIEYRLFDCAYFSVHGQCETSIGKLISMYETSGGERVVKVLWFFRPGDIRSFLGDYEPHWDELFLACGDGAGVYNINNVESVVGKCNVVCESLDPRNPRPSRRDSRNANFVFSRTFNTSDMTISDIFPQGIAGVGVEKLFNKIRENPPLQRPSSSAGATTCRASQERSQYSGLVSTKSNRDGKLINRTVPVKKDMLFKDPSDYPHVAKNPAFYTDSRSRDPRTKTRELGKVSAPGSSGDLHPVKKRKIHDSDDSAPQPKEQRLMRNPPPAEKPLSQNIEKSSWYKKLPFEEELKSAMEKGRWLLIENLEPSLTSLEVEDLCWEAFNERVDAKMIPSTKLFSPHNGRALVLFGTTTAADNALSRLTEGCLMLSDQRPLVGSRNIPKDVKKCSSFPGHFGLMRKACMSFEKRKAVATSHCAQSNHVVCQMAMQWFGLQKTSELVLKELFEEQAKEIDDMLGKNNQEIKR